MNLPKGDELVYIHFRVAAQKVFYWKFLTRLKSNRLVNPDGKGNVPISSVAIPAAGVTA